MCTIVEVPSLKSNWRCKLIRAFCSLIKTTQSENNNYHMWLNSHGIMLNVWPIANISTSKYGFNVTSLLYHRWSMLACCITGGQFWFDQFSEVVSCWQYGQGSGQHIEPTSKRPGIHLPVNCPHCLFMI